MYNPSDYPYIELASSCIEQLNNLIINYPINVHEWRSHLHSVNCYYIMVTEDLEKDKTPKYYNDLIEAVTKANLYIVNWINKNVM
jgi:hypothetical protein